MDTENLQLSLAPIDTHCLLFTLAQEQRQEPDNTTTHVLNNHIYNHLLSRTPFNIFTSLPESSPPSFTYLKQLFDLSQNDNEIYYYIRKHFPSINDLEHLSIIAGPYCIAILTAIVIHLTNHKTLQHYKGLYPVTHSISRYLLHTYNLSLPRNFKGLIDFSHFLSHNSQQLDCPQSHIYYTIKNKAQKLADIEKQAKDSLC
jgi:hypothetical protein